MNSETTPIDSRLVPAREALIPSRVLIGRLRATSLHGRISERFIEPIDFLIETDEAKLPTERRFGFAILALDCLLVETLGAFIDGLEDTRGKSEPTFCRFLMKRPRFASVFTSETLAKQFYIEFRCGILHQAEVGWRSKPSVVSGTAYQVRWEENHCQSHRVPRTPKGRIRQLRRRAPRWNG